MAVESILVHLIVQAADRSARPASQVSGLPSCLLYPLPFFLTTTQLTPPSLYNNIISRFNLFISKHLILNHNINIIDCNAVHLGAITPHSDVTCVLDVYLVAGISHLDKNWAGITLNGTNIIGFFKDHF